MNERIKELARQSQMVFWPTDPEVVELSKDIDIEKFAELIVQECISTVENLSPGYDDYRNQIEDAFRRDCVEQMKQHFGVGE